MRVTLTETETINNKYINIMNTHIKFLVDILKEAMETHDNVSMQALNDLVREKYVNDTFHSYWLQDIGTLLAPRSKAREFAQALFLTRGKTAAVRFANEYGHLVDSPRRGRESNAMVQMIPFLHRLSLIKELTPKCLNYQRAIGVEIEGFSPHEREVLAKEVPYFCRIAYDASIRHPENTVGAEVRLLLNRASPEPRLQSALSVLKKLDFRTNRSCGLHVHMHAAHLSLNDRHEKQKIMLAWLRLLKNFVPPSRRENDYTRLNITNTTARRNRYAAVNIQTGRKDTIEVRLHSATTDATKIMMWIRLCELLFAMPKPRPSLGHDLAALDALPLCEWDKSYWRQRFFTLNPATINHNTSEETE